MKVLLDTNIVIHRETNHIINQDIGTLFRWLDKTHCEKIIHCRTVQEIEKNSNDSTVSAFQVKMQNYEIIENPAPMADEVLAVSNKIDTTVNDKTDSILLNEVFKNRVDALITEDKKIHKKAEMLAIKDKVFTIDSFLEKIYEEHPDLVDYKVLNVQKIQFGKIDLSDPFFQTLKDDYTGFEKWFLRKFDDEAYITINSNNGKLLSFLYLKVEDETENYSDIQPVFSPKKRLKVGTFKVISNGFRLGERFLKIIFDNALKNKVQEIYVTIFDKRDEQKRLISLMEKWGFSYWGKKGEENVYVRDFTPAFMESDINKTYPYISRNKDIFIVPICLRGSVFPERKLRDMWNYNSHRKPFVVNFLYVYSFPQRINMEKLINLGIFNGINDAPRGFRKITKEQFNMILKETKSESGFIVD